MQFEAKFEQFEGPLDLMLHLISAHKLDIMDLDTNALADQYLQYLQRMEEMHLEIEGEYLAELATLLEIKSRGLLPKKKEENEEEDPKDVLVRRLLEYQRYKEASETLKNAFESRQNQFSKPLSEVVEEESDNGKLSGNPYDLYKAMNRILRRQQLSKPLETQLRRKEISMDDRILELKARLIHLPSTFDLETLTDDCHDLYEFVVSFLAILVMAQQHVLSFTTDEQDRIWFRKGVDHV